MIQYTKEQLELLKEAKPSNYISVKLGWALTLVLPFKEGMQLITNLEMAEKLDEGKIMPLNTDDRIEISLISKEKYIEDKMKHLLHIEKEEEE